MNFCDYLEIFKKNNLNQFLQKEQNCQIAKYKQKKYRQIIKKKSVEKNTQFLKDIEKYVTFYGKNRNGKNKLNIANKEENIIQKFNERYYKIKKEEDFYLFIKQNYKEISFDVASKEENDIDNYIHHFQDLVENFQNWFEKTPRKRRKTTPIKFLTKKIK